MTPDEFNVYEALRERCDRYRDALKKIVEMGEDEEREDDDPEEMYFECDEIARTALKAGHK